MGEAINEPKIQPYFILNPIMWYTKGAPIHGFIKLIIDF